MAELEYFVISESAAVDQQTNRMSIFNVLESVKSPVFPVILPGAVATVSWLRGEGDAGQDFMATLRLPWVPEAQRDLNQAFTFGEANHRNIFYLRGLPIPDPGTFRFELLLNNEHVAYHTVVASLVEAE